jgi:hypothetical protein
MAMHALTGKGHRLTPSIDRPRPTTRYHCRKKHRQPFCGWCGVGRGTLHRTEERMIFLEIQHKYITYERKCPDLIINGQYYEYENYRPPFKKEKYRT